MQTAVKTLSRIGLLIRMELSRVVDVPAWQDATTARDRAASISWPRAGLIALVIAAPIMVGAILTSRPRAYAPPQPTERVRALYIEAERNVGREPPAGLVEANRSRP